MTPFIATIAIDNIIRPQMMVIIPPIALE